MARGEWAGSWETTPTNHLNKCPYCNNIHDGVCPLVAAFEYHPNGTLKRVEFKRTQVDWTKGIGAGPLKTDLHIR